MKQKTMLYAAGAVGVGLVVLAARRGALLGGDAERMGGMRALYGVNAGQQAGVQAAVAQSWQALNDSVFKTQPDFWV